MSNASNDEVCIAPTARAFPAEYAARSVSHMVWSLGRCLLLLWLQRTRSLEPYFVARPIRSSLLLAKRTLRALEKYRTVFADDLGRIADLCVEISLRRRLDDESLFRSGLLAIDSAGWSREGFSTRHARYMHLRGFVLRIHGDVARYDVHQERFVSLLDLVQDDPSAAQYRCRLDYEDASRCLHDPLARDVRKALRSFKANSLHALELKQDDERDSVDHLLFGSSRSIVRCHILLQDFGGALRAWNHLLDRAPTLLDRHLIRDGQLLCDVRKAASHHSEWRAATRGVPSALIRSLEDPYLSKQRRRFLNHELLAWQEIQSPEKGGHEVPESKPWLVSHGQESVVLC